jgi:hypothetical protein
VRTSSFCASPYRFSTTLAESGEIALDFNKIIIRNLCSLCLQGRFELGSELSELFLVHDVLHDYG